MSRNPPVGLLNDMPRQTEPNANSALGDLLRGMMPRCQVLSGNTQTFSNHPGRHADVLITAPGRSPVVVEAEYEPAPEEEEAAVALRYPQAVEDAYDVRQAVAEARLSYCVLHEDGNRFPESGWLDGTVTDLADLIRLVSVPQKAVNDAAAALEQGIGHSANELDDMAKLRPNITPAIAKDILEQIPGDTAAGLLRGLRETAQRIDATGVDNAHDLTGRIFQRLIADRKYLATFYTLPASAALLARIAAAKMDGVDWSDAAAIGKLRIGDFACGTGALLAAVYEQIASHHERTGGDASALHPVMPEHPAARRALRPG